jgi:tripartite-type tricarboxylate transporter receptor subunit TctC
MVDGHFGRGELIMYVSQLQRSLFACVGLLLSTFTASAQSDFYRGKTINIMVGFGSGGVYELYSRLLARYLPKFLPGSPAVVVQNMTGAGGVRAANYVFSAAAKDGTYIASVNQGAAMYQLLEGEGVAYDLTKAHWLGSMGSSNNVLYVWYSTGVKTLKDAKQTEVVLAGSGVISDADIYPSVLNAIAGTKFRVIDGYQGTNDSNLAIERGEVMGRGGGAYSNLVRTKPDWLRERKINILSQVGLSKDPDLPDVPLLTEIGLTEEDRQIASVVTLPTVIGYNQWVAPEVPSDRLLALRSAYAAALSDPELLSDAEKQQLDIRYVPGDQIAKLVNEAARVPKPVLQRLKAILRW